MRKQKLTIFFANHAQFEGAHTNLGDWAIFEQMYEAFRQYFSACEVEVIVPSSEPDFTGKHYQVKTIKRGGLKGVFNHIKYLLRSDLVLVGGGELIQDKSSMVYIPYQLIRPLFAKLFGKKIFGYAIGVGEKYEVSKPGKAFSRFVLNLFDLITVRDEKSAVNLKEWIGVKVPIYVTADPAINLVKKPTFILEKPTAIFSVRSVYHRQHDLLPFAIKKKLGLVNENYFKEVEKFKGDIANIVDFVTREIGYNVLFINTYCGTQMSGQDDLFTQSLIKKCKNIDRVKVLNEFLIPSQIKDIISQSEFVISVPLHPLILAASENIPTISLSYASKSIAFMHEIGQDEYVHEVIDIGQRLDMEKIKNQICFIIKNRCQIQRQIKEYVEVKKQKERETLEYLNSVIKDIKK